ncbi:NAD(P)/FAD-dependent oxidoreductase [Kurthia sibirica]|uniref:NAD(P)/FAD-dependent oxidoreductase n=1 Tax=Kurthia sibirica TaxID=202750 RepID=A0A2U3ANC5_9BACL|nr:NAD(P)/FAD-dependent oxidoreductase [Kurthia sibirica]PWI26021.1 NAD(P)/FAD-dependent oxidoreductase [Kurthia sibirica]GEK34578.1 hypothetical protein KSI01_21110 [Kurthia sibirica]
MLYDCIIIGGGPAGLNAALVLGRSRRNVLIFDSNEPRNAVTNESHGYLTRDGITPSEFREIGYKEILKYPTVEHKSEKVTVVEKIGNHFLIVTENNTVKTRKVLISTGLKEILPDLKGLKDKYGKSLFYCPYCDGWELRDRPLIVISENPGVHHLAKLLYNWSKDLIVCTNGQQNIFSEEQEQQLSSKNIRVITKEIAALHGDNGQLEEVEFSDGNRINRTGGFIIPKWFNQLKFSENLGYDVNEHGAILTDNFGTSTVPGLFAAGEAATGTPTLLIISAASGSIAAARINLELTEEEFSL